MTCTNLNCRTGKVYTRRVVNGQLYEFSGRCPDCNPAPAPPEPTPKKRKKHVDLTVREYSEQGYLIQ